MANSKRTRILEYLRATVLPSITVANGYNFTLTNIARGHKGRTNLADHELPAVYIVMTDEKRHNITHNQYQANPLQVILVGYVKNSKASPGASGVGVQLDLDNLIQDLTKAISTDLTQNGLVTNTEITDITTDEGDLNSIAGVVLTVEFQYVAEGITP